MPTEGSSAIHFGVWKCMVLAVCSLSAATLCRAQNIVGNPPATQTITQPVNTNANVNRFENIRFADQFPGTGAHDCGDKINQADQDLYTSPPGGGTSISGEIWVNSNCGATITTPVSINNYHVLRFIDQPAPQSGQTCYQVSAKIQIGNAARSSYGTGIIGRSSGQLSVPGPICLQMADGANMPVMIQMAGPQSFIRDIFLDGNKNGSKVPVPTPNLTAGTILQLQSDTNTPNSAWFQEVDHVTIQNSRGLGTRVMSTGTNGETSAPTFTRVSWWGNELGCIETEHTVNVNIKQSFCENSGLGGGPLGGANYPVVNTSGSSVTWVSGSKWTTDSSIVGRTVVISGARYTVASVASTTSLTLNTSAGTQTNVQMHIGTGIELFDSRGSGVYFTDVSGHETDGIYNYGLNPATNVGAWGMVFQGDTFSADMEDSLYILGFDAPGAAFASYSNQILNNYFGGNINGSTSAIHGGLYIQDSYGNLISGNTFEAFNTTTHGFAIKESVAGREGTNSRDVFAMNNLCWGSFSGSCVTQNVQNPPVSSVLYGQTGPIGGQTVAAGTCTSGAVVINGAVPGMPAVAAPSDGLDIGGRFFVKAYATALNTVSVWVCAVIDGTPPAKTYNVRLVQ